MNELYNKRRSIATLPLYATTNTVMPPVSLTSPTVSKLSLPSSLSIASLLLGGDGDENVLDTCESIEAIGKSGKEQGQQQLPQPPKQFSDLPPNYYPLVRSASSTLWSSSFEREQFNEIINRTAIASSTEPKTFSTAIGNGLLNNNRQHKRHVATSTRQQKSRIDSETQTVVNRSSLNEQQFQQQFSRQFIDGRHKKNSSSIKDNVDSMSVGNGDSDDDNEIEHKININDNLNSNQLQTNGSRNYQRNIQYHSMFQNERNRDVGEVKDGKFKDRLVNERNNDDNDAMNQEKGNLCGLRGLRGIRKTKDELFEEFCKKAGVRPKPKNIYYIETNELTEIAEFREHEGHRNVHNASDDDNLNEIHIQRLENTNMNNILSKRTPRSERRTCILGNGLSTYVDHKLDVEDISASHNARSNTGK